MQLKKNQQTAETMRDQVNSFKDQIIIHGLNVRIEHELQQASLLTMKADILQKLDTFNACDDFIPEQLQEDIEHELNSLLQAVGAHLRQHDDCTNDCKLILDKLEEILREVDTLNGLQDVLQEKVLNVKENVVQLILPKEVDGLLQAGRNDYTRFLREELPTKHRIVLDFVNKLGVTLRPTTSNTTSSSSSTINAEELSSSSSSNTDISKRKRRHTETITIDEDEDIINCKKRKPSTNAVNAATQTSVKGVTELNRIEQECKQSQTILNITAKKEEYEKKIETLLAKWNSDREESSDYLNAEMLCCYMWNKQVFPNNNVSTLNCFTKFKGCRNPCKLEHKCTYVMPCGNICLSPDHTYMQHGLFYDMPFSEAQDLHDCGILTEERCNLVENICLNRDARLGLTKYGRICNWVSKFGLLDDCELPVIPDTDIIDETFFN